MPATSKTSKTADDESHVALDVPGQSSHEDDPKLPHERDESVGMTGGEPSAKMKQAHKDVSRGLQDTGRGPEADRAYQKQKR